MNYTRFLNRLSLARQPSPIRVLTAIVQQSPPSMISMAGGMPNADTFPIESATLKLRDGTTLEMPENVMKQALQYSPTPGVPGLVSWVKGLQENVHNVPENKYDLLITNGSQDGICKSFEAMVNPGDNVLVECPSYSGTLAALKPMDCNLIPLKADGQGLDPDSLKQVLSGWSVADVGNNNSDIPKLLYLIPNGGNPTGHGLTEERKREIYKIAQTYNLLILEDDPYFYLQFNRPYVPSLLSMDVDSRVVRFDSFSKLISSGPRGETLTPTTTTSTSTDNVAVLAGAFQILSQNTFSDSALNLRYYVAATPKVPATTGSILNGVTLRMRLGCVTGPKPILDRIGLHMQASVMHASGLSQVVLLQVLQQWGYTGFQKHADSVMEFYKQRRDQCVRAAETHLKGLAEWSEPAGGMFLWLKLDVPDTYKMITVKAREKEVLFVPGNAFQADDTQPCQYIRASYSMCTEEQMDKAFQRLAALIREEQAGTT